MRLLYWILAGPYSQEYQVKRVMVRQSQAGDEVKDKVAAPRSPVCGILCSLVVLSWKDTDTTTCAKEITSESE